MAPSVVFTALGAKHRQKGGKLLDRADVELVEAAIGAALARGTTEGLLLLGYGEITVVVGWPTSEPRVAVKRLPPLADRGRVERYANSVHAYCHALTEHGVHVVPQQTHVVPAHGGGWALHVVQPMYASEQLAVDHLRRDDPYCRELIARVVTMAMLADHGLGVDAQITNWVVVDGVPRLIDTTTPMMRVDGGFVLDIGLILTPFPAATRPLLRRFVVPDVLARYHDPRSIAIDIAANLHREDLARWIPAVLDAANDRLPQPIERDEVDRYYRQDARLWSTIQLAKRMNRGWTTHVRRKTFPILLPPPIHC